MAEPLIYHRGPDFPLLLRGVVEKLKPIFPTVDDVLLLSASGSGGMEAAVVNTLSRGDRVIVVQAGQFGAKWTAICKAYGLNIDIIDLPWGQAVDPGQIAERLTSDIRAVFTTQSETSTGVLHNIAAVAQIVKHTDTLLIVDGVSSVVAHALPTGDWGVDIAITASQKGLGVPPGVAIVTVSKRAWVAMNHSDLPKNYFDLKAYKTAFDEGRGPATLPVTLIAGLRAALDLLHTEGIENAWKRHARHAQAVRQATEALGLSVFAACPSNALTAIGLPKQLDGVTLMHHMLTRYGITLGGGLAHLRGRLIRISNLGHVDDLDILSVISALEMGLRAQGWEFTPGAGVGAAEAVLG
jgi:aspartate aminotransferase-like enzyme